MGLTQPRSSVQLLTQGGGDQAKAITKVKKQSFNQTCAKSWGFVWCRYYKKKILTRRWIRAPVWLINPTWLSSVTTRPRACHVQLEQDDISWKKRNCGRNNKRVCADGAPAGSDCDSWFGSDKVMTSFLWSGAASATVAACSAPPLLSARGLQLLLVMGTTLWMQDSKSACGLSLVQVGIFFFF